MRKISILVIAAGLSLAGAAGARAEGKRFKVLTFNVWGIVGAKARVIRAEAIGKRIAELDPDVIALEEAFEGRHRRILTKSLEDAGYPVRDFRCFKNVYGSGLYFITKWEIESAEFEPYRVIGGPADIEWIGGKGIAHIRLKTPWGPLDFFHTHAIARMTQAFDEQGKYIPGDPKQIDRLLHMHQINRFIRQRRDPRARSIIAAGDFNVSPEMLCYDFLMKVTGFENSFDLANPGENPSTFSTRNVWVPSDQEYSRIDHIMFKNYAGSSGFWLRPVESEVVMDRGFEHPRTGEKIDYSDHYGLMTRFEVVTDPALVSRYSDPGMTEAGCPCRSSCPEDYQGGAIRLTADNRDEWADFAMHVFAESYEKQDRRNKALAPLAKAVVADPDELPAVVELSGKAAKRLDRLCGIEPGPFDKLGAGGNGP